MINVRAVRIKKARDDYNRRQAKLLDYALDENIRLRERLGLPIRVCWDGCVPSVRPVDRYYGEDTTLKYKSRKKKK